jgi:hypothetical protein
VGLTGSAAKISDEAARISANRMSEGRMKGSKGSSSTLKIPPELERNIVSYCNRQVNRQFELRSILNVSAEAATFMHLG